MDSEAGRIRRFDEAGVFAQNECDNDLAMGKGTSINMCSCSWSTLTKPQSKSFQRHYYFGK